MDALQPLEMHLKGLIDEQQRAEEEQASPQSLKAIQKAFHEALLALPPEEYDWFDIQAKARHDTALRANGSAEVDALAFEEGSGSAREPALKGPPQRQFFDVAGPLFSVVVSPAAGNVSLKDRCIFRALPRDRSRRRVTEALTFAWQIIQGNGAVSAHADQEIEFLAPASPGLVQLQVVVTQRDVTVTAEALITVTDSLESALNPAVVNSRGLPGYTFERAAGELWRCRFDAERNIIVVNSGHRDFVFATRNRALQLRYLVRLYVKELVLKNFAGMSAEQLLERMIELSLYAEEQLKSG